MRIIAGAWRGRVLSAPGPTTRPTADRVRQAVFDRLMHAPWAGPMRDAVVLDAYAGTGALGLEALSRGAAHAVFMERDRAALHVLRANIAACGAEAQCTVLAADVLRPPPGRPCGLVFLDPPYATAAAVPAVAALRAAGWLAPGAVLVAETGVADPAPELPNPLVRFAHGAAAVHVFTA